MSLFPDILDNSPVMSLTVTEDEVILSNTVVSNLCVSVPVSRISLNNKSTLFTSMMTEITKKLALTITANKWPVLLQN